MPDDPPFETIPVVEESVSVSKRQVVTGRVRVATRTEVIEEHLPAELTSTEVEVTRVPVDRRVESVPDVTTRGDVTIIPVVEERLVVTRELYLREEVHVRRVDRRESVEIPAEVRKQTVHIERLPEARDQIQSSSKDEQDDL